MLLMRDKTRHVHRHRHSMKPLFSFGLVADIQYADVDDCLASDGNQRYYRGTLAQLRTVVKGWSASRHPLSFAIQLGDAIDHKNIAIGNTNQALMDVKSILEESPVPVYNTVGNHELYNFPRKGIQDFIPFPPAPPSLLAHASNNPSGKDKEDQEELEQLLCYSFKPHPGWHFIAIDSFDISLLGNSPQSRSHRQALELIQAHNSNADLDDCSGLEGLEQRFGACNGALGPAQLAWLEEELQQSALTGEKAVVYGHVPLHPDAARASCLTLNYQEVLQVLHKFHHVVAYFAGHDHPGGFVQDSHGIHHITLQGIVETPPNSEAYAVCHVFPDHIEVEGHGSIPSRTLSCKAEKAEEQAEERSCAMEELAEERSLVEEGEGWPCALLVTA